MGLSTLKAGVSTAGVEDLADREARILRTRLRELAAEANARGTAVARFAEEVADLASLGGVGTLRPHEVISAVEYTAAAGLPGESPVEMAEAEAAAGAAGAVRMHYGRFEQKIVVRPARPAEGGDVTLTRPARYLDRWHAAAAWRRRRRRLSGAGRDVGGQDMYLRKTRANRAAARQAGAGTSVLYPAGCGRRDAAPSVASSPRHLSSPAPWTGPVCDAAGPGLPCPRPSSSAPCAPAPALSWPCSRYCPGRPGAGCGARAWARSWFPAGCPEGPGGMAPAAAASWISESLIPPHAFRVALCFPSRPRLSESSDAPSAFRVAECVAGRFR